MSVNKVMLIGNLGQDPTTNEYNGVKFCNFSIATSEKWKDKQSGELKEETQWHNISVAGPQAEACGKYLEKGRQVFVEGSLRYETSEKDGVTKYFTKIRAMNVRFLSGGSSEAGKSVQSNDGGDQVPF